MLRALHGQRCNIQFLEVRAAAVEEMEEVFQGLGFWSAEWMVEEIGGGMKVEEQARVPEPAGGMETEMETEMVLKKAGLKDLLGLKKLLVLEELLDLKGLLMAEVEADDHPLSAFQRREQPLRNPRPSREQSVQSSQESMPMLYLGPSIPWKRVTIKIFTKIALCSPRLRAQGTKAIFREREPGPPFSSGNHSFPTKKK